MSLEFRPPDRICLSGNLADNWCLWKQGFMLFMTATESDGKADKIKFAMLLASIGPEERRWIDSTSSRSTLLPARTEKFTTR